MFTNQLLGLTKTISPTDDTDPMDVVKTKSALAQTGHYEVPEVGITPIPDQPMIDGLKTFQKENDLKVDGIMKPNGPTENALGQQVKPITLTPPQKEEAKVPKPLKLDPLTGLEEIKLPIVQKLKTAIVPEGKTVQQRIQSMMWDKRYNDPQDSRLRDHVVRQFETAYPGKVEYDETGKMIQAQAVIKPEEVEPFDPDGELEHVNAKSQLNQIQSSIAEAESEKADEKQPENLGLRPDEKWTEPSPGQAMHDACRLHRHKKKHGKYKSYKKMLDEVIDRYGGYRKFYAVLEQNDLSNFPESCG